MDTRPVSLPDRQPERPWVRSLRRERGGDIPEPLRRAVLREAGFRCQLPGCTAPAPEVDHKVPVSQGGKTERSNLQAICKAHHREKTQREAQAARAARRRVECEPHPGLM